jgi:hypothetical protein
VSTALFFTSYTFAKRLEDFRLAGRSETDSAGAEPATVKASAEFDPILVCRSLGAEGRGFSEGKANWNSA